MSRYLLRGVLALLASLLAACSSFDRHWNDAAQEKGGASRWDGQWKSERNVYANGAYHHGRLRCVLVPQADRSLAAHFHANWLIFSGNYDMTLHPVAGGPRRREAGKYQGTHDLPAMFGGTYRYQATVEGDRFVTHYTSSYDTGTFDLRRVPPAKEHADLHAQH